MTKDQVRAILTATEVMVNKDRGTADFNIELIHYPITHKLPDANKQFWKTIIHFNEPDGSGLIVKGNEFDTSEESLADILPVALSCLVGTVKHGTVDNYERSKVK